MRCERRDRVPRQNSLAEMAASQRDVRLTSESGHVCGDQHVRFAPKADIAPFVRSSRRDELHRSGD